MEKSNNKDEFKFEVRTNGNGKDEYCITKNSLPFINVESDLVEVTKAEILDWYSYLNNVMGFVSFTFALAVQGTPNVYFNAAMSLAWVLMAHFWLERNKFPSHLAYMQKSKEPSSRFLAINIEKIHLSYWEIIKKAPLFLIGYLYLLFLVLMSFDRVRTVMVFGETIQHYLLLK